MKVVSAVSLASLAWFADAATPQSLPAPGWSGDDGAVVRALWPELADWIASLYDAEIADSIPELGLFLLASETVEDDVLVEAVSASGLVAFAERSRWVTTPEADGCAPSSGAGSQQCSISFVDGVPSLESFLSQPATEVLGLAAAADAVVPVADVVVAVVDTGVDPSHPLLADRLVGPGIDLLDSLESALDLADGVDDDADGLVDEAWGHGTHVASCIVLVHPEAMLLPIRALDSDGSGSSWDVARAIVLAVTGGADIVNLSLSLAEESLAVATAIEYAEANDVLVVTSAGNAAGGEALFPGSYDPADLPLLVPAVSSKVPVVDGALLAVGAIDAGGGPAPFSSWGDSLDVVCPGVDVYGALPGGNWGWWSGTSMSAGLASGVAALVLAAEPSWRGAALGERLMSTAAPLPDGPAGVGQLDVWAAVSAPPAGEDDDD